MRESTRKYPNSIYSNYRKRKRKYTYQKMDPTKSQDDRIYIQSTVKKDLPHYPKLMQ